MAENPYEIAKRENSARPLERTGRRIDPLAVGSKESKIKAVEKMFALLKRPKDMGDMRIMSAGYIEVLGPLPEHCVTCAANDFIHGHMGNGWVPYPGELAKVARQRAEGWESVRDTQARTQAALLSPVQIEKLTPQQEAARRVQVEAAYDLFEIHGHKDSRGLPKWERELPPLEKGMSLAEPSPELLRKLRA